MLLSVLRLLSQLNQAFMRKVPSGSQAVNILVGEVDFLERPIMAFVRLNQAMSLGDLTEVPVPTRFFFLLLGPTGKCIWSMASLLSLNTYEAASTHYY